MRTWHVSGGVVAAEVLAAAAAGGRLALALSPSAIDREVVAALASDERLRRNAHVFLADTCFDDRVEGAAGVRQLLRPMVARDAQLHLDVLNHGDVERGAAAYEQELRAFFGLAVGELPRFDMAVLRIGPCGGISGLLADSLALDETNRIAVANRSAARGERFVTLTPPVIQRATRVVISAGSETMPLRRPFGIAERLLAASNVKLLA